MVIGPQHRVCKRGLRPDGGIPLLELYKKEHEQELMATVPCVQGEHEALMLDMVIAAEEEMAEHIGGESIVFLLPWVRITSQSRRGRRWPSGTCRVRKRHGERGALGTPERDPEYTQTL